MNKVLKFTGIGCLGVILIGILLFISGLIFLPKQEIKDAFDKGKQKSKNEVKISLSQDAVKMYGQAELKHQLEKGAKKHALDIEYALLGLHNTTKYDSYTERAANTTAATPVNPITAANFAPSVTAAVRPAGELKIIIMTIITITRILNSLV